MGTNAVFVSEKMKQEIAAAKVLGVRFAIVPRL